MREEKMIGEPTAESATAVFKALADPTRLRIFATLLRGASCNGWLSEELDLPSNLLSHHLKALREAGLVQDRRDAVDGRWIYYQVDLHALETLYQWFVQFFDPTRVALEPQAHLCGPEGKFSGEMLVENAMEETAA
jgi:ArsR family transcriptional regulator, arsenate/arsenite/antimonite-responsive transcriptional repressor